MDKTPPDCGNLAFELQGAGPGILLVHGFAGNRGVWREVAGELSRDHAVLGVDLPGSGESPFPPVRDGEADFAAIAARLAARVQASSLGPCLAVGHSMGGALAALAVLEAPTAFRGLVLVDGSLRPGPPLGPAQWELLDLDPQGFFEGYLAPRCFSLPQGTRVVREALAMAPQAVACYLRHLGRDDLHGRLDRLELPVALFTPSTPPRDPALMPSWLARRGLDGLRSLRVATFPGCGHWLMWDDPAGFVARLRDFEASLAD